MESLSQELHLKLQERALPQRVEVPGLDIATRYFPSLDTLGGDWYDVFSVNDGESHYVGIGDVQGHDVEAALQMSQLRLALRSTLALADMPSWTFSRMNDVWQTMDFTRFATLLYVRLNRYEGITISRCGHHEALLLRDGHARLMETEVNPPLGLGLDLWEYVSERVDLRVGDVFVLYTDGLVEPDIDANVARACAILEAAAAPDVSAEQIAARIEAAMSLSASRDDIAFVVVRVLDR